MAFACNEAIHVFSNECHWSHDGQIDIGFFEDLCFALHKIHSWLMSFHFPMQTKKCTSILNWKTGDKARSIWYSVGGGLEFWSGPGREFFFWQNRSKIFFFAGVTTNNDPRRIMTGGSLFYVEKWPPVIILRRKTTPSRRIMSPTSRINTRGVIIQRVGYRKMTPIYYCGASEAERHLGIT